jgi:hypothetical protein
VPDPKRKKPSPSKSSSKATRGLSVALRPYHIEFSKHVTSTGFLASHVCSLSCVAATKDSEEEEEEEEEEEQDFGLILSLIATN